VVEAITEVIEWHEKGLLPLGAHLSSDSRCRLVQGDFFAMATSSPACLDPESPDRRFDAIIVDIDHSPRQLLHPDHAAFYEREGLKRLAAQLGPAGIFALWSNDPPDKTFCRALDAAFRTSRAEVFRFPNPLLDCEEASTFYIARN
jgi:spermidine synthase